MTYLLDGSIFKSVSFASGNVNGNLDKSSFVYSIIIFSFVLLVLI